MITYSIEYRSFIGCFYYTMIFACDVFFFLMIDWRTQSLLRIYSTSIFAFAASITTVAFFIFGLPQNNLIEIVPILRRIVYRNQMNRFLQMKIEDLHYQMTVDQTIGVNCARVYTITNLTNIRTLISFCLNVILILNLFQDYFSKI